MLFLCNIANIAQRTFEIIQRSRSRGHGDIILLTSTYVDYNYTNPENSMCEVSSTISRKLLATDFVYDNGIIGVSLLHV